MSFVTTRGAVYRVRDPARRPNDLRQDPHIGVSPSRNDLFAESGLQENRFYGVALPSLPNCWNVVHRSRKSERVNRRRAADNTDNQRHFTFAHPPKTQGRPVVPAITVEDVSGDGGDFPRRVNRLLNPV
jgi:hypothetical protein